MTPDPTAELRRAFYLLLGLAAVGAAAARVCGTELAFEPSRFAPEFTAVGGTIGTTNGSRNVDSYGRSGEHRVLRPWPEKRPSPTPFFYSNDRSRWATVRALVDEGTYSIGRQERLPGREPVDRGIVSENDYATIDKVKDPETGKYYSSKPPLFATLVAGEYWLLKTALGWDIVRDRWPVAIAILLTWNVLPFGIYLVVLARLLERHAATDFGRLFGFAVAAGGTFLVTFAPTLNNHTPGAYCTLFAVAPLLGGPPTRRQLAVSGFFAGFAVTFDLPSAALLGGLGLLTLLACRWRAGWFALGAALPIFALLLTNYLAFGFVEPVYSRFDSEWYRYPGSHWSRIGTPQGKGIDFLHEPVWVYALHVVVGHHGWFSLTPAWLVGLVGLWAAGRRTRGWLSAGWLARLTALVTLVVVAFYLTRADSRNYGGNSCCARWLVWLTPLWVLLAAAGADGLGRSRWGRWACGLAFGVSAFSAAYASWNPWRPPWLQQLLFYCGMIDY